MKYMGMEYTKKELLAYAGNIQQLAGVTRTQLTEGNGEGAHLIEVRNGSGLEFSVLESRCMDIYTMSYKGIPLNFLSKNGLFYPLRYLPTDAEDTQKHLTGGLLYTCGTTNVGRDCVEAGKKQVCHGRIKAMSATNTSARGVWRGDNYEMEVYGEVRETTLFEENVALRRSIRTEFGIPVLRMTDVIENEGFAEQAFMYMYHLNLGFPLIDEQTVICVSPSTITARDEEMKKYMHKYCKIDKPEYPGHEVCLMHDFPEKKQMVTGVINRKLGIGFYIKQDTHVMAYLHEWKTNIAGAYALGLEPANNHAEGRVREREHYKTLQTIKPFQKIVIEIEMGVIEGEQALAAFEALYKT
ncbi:MAG: aldose 1-epimerase family protein [Clostridia bacterium]